MRQLPTAPFAAASLLTGWGVVEATGSRPLGGAVMLAGGIGCAAVWRRRHGNGTAVALTGVGLGAFVLSHVLSLGLGVPPWPAVITVSAVTAAIVWVKADAPGGLPVGAGAELG